MTLKDLTKYNFRTKIYYVLGILSIGMAYIGFVTPGIPFSIFLVAAAWFFSRSSPRMHQWLYSHPWFGAFLTNWEIKRIFPTRFKYAMVIVMITSFIFFMITVQSTFLRFLVAVIMIAVAAFTWRYPGSEEEYRRRQSLK